MFLTAFIMTIAITVIMTGGRLLSNNRPDAARVFIAAFVGFFVNLVGNWLFLWLFLPAMTGWFGGYFALGLPLAVNVVVAWIACGVEYDGYDRNRGTSALASATLGSVILVILLVLLFIAAINPLYGADALRDIPQIKVTEEKTEEVSIEHIRLIPLEAAQWLGDAVVGKDNLGAQFRLGQFEIQRIRGRLYWAAPLEFRDFWKWLDAGVTPGYVLVSAEEGTQKAELHTGYKMKYVPSASFGNKLNRYLYENGWSNYIIQEPTFEVDEDMKPWWVVTVGHPTVGLSGEVVDGAVIIDPESGKMQFYPLGQTPEWADRVIPYSLAIEYNNWWGNYVYGFWNTVFVQRDVQKTTDIQGVQDVFLVYGRDNHAKWFTGFTSPSTKDASLTGYSMMNSVTGATLFYKVSGIGHEGKVVQAVNASVSNYKEWHGSQPIFYNIYGEESWVVPVLSGGNILQRVAVVHAETLKVILGATKQDALMAYQTWLVERGSNRPPSQTSVVLEAEGRVVRIAADVRDGRTVYFFWIDTVPDRIFVANSSVSDKLVLTQIGDRVQVLFVDIEERTVAVSRFGNLDILPQVPVAPRTPAAVHTPEPGFNVIAPTIPRVAVTPTPTATPTPIPSKKYYE